MTLVILGVGVTSAPTTVVESGGEVIPPSSVAWSEMTKVPSSATVKLNDDPVDTWYGFPSFLTFHAYVKPAAWSAGSGLVAEPRNVTELPSGSDGGSVVMVAVGRTPETASRKETVVVSPAVLVAVRVTIEGAPPSSATGAVHVHAPPAPDCGATWP